MTYSSQKEISTLKRKLDQVAQCGCKAFALLFDDIEPDMSPADKEVFQSFAHAQVKIILNILYICLQSNNYFFNFRCQLQMKYFNILVNPNF